MKSLAGKKMKVVNTECIWSLNIKALEFVLQGGGVANVDVAQGFLRN